MPALMKVLIVVLLVVTAGEALYYVYIVYSNNKMNIASQSGQLAALPSIAVQNPATSAGLLKADRAVTAQTMTILDRRLNGTKKEFMPTAYVYSELQGQIVSVTDQPFTTIDGKTSYSVGFLVKSPSGATTHFTFTGSEASQMKVFLVNKNVETPINITDIKKGDMILIKHKVNLLKADYETGVESVTVDVTRN